MRRWLMWGTLGIVFPVLAIQAVPYGHDHTNPPVQQEPAWDSAQTRELAVRACFDCHSNQTVWPWYSNVAPVSWLVQHDVNEGRQRLNFSQMNTAGRGSREAGETVLRGSMPPEIYLTMHPQANLSSAERQQLTNGLAATLGGGGEFGRQTRP
ncbi:MAG: heme-binding domain-containing protein [Chloroflexota bacterium]